MTAKGPTWAIVLMVAALSVQGCAGTQPKPQGVATEALGGQNLDLLFATEFPVESKQEALARAGVAWREGEADKALFYSVKALTFDRSDVALMVQIAGLHERLGDKKMAARAYRLALKEDPAYAPALEGIGLLYFNAGQREKAGEYLEAAAAGDPDLWRTFNALGILADGRRQFDLARKHYDRALAINPQSVGARINRGWSRFLAGDLENAARELYEVAFETNNPKAWRNLAMVYGRQGWYDESLQVLRKVEDEAKANNRMGLMAMENRELDRAEDFFAAALRHSPVHYVEAERNLEEVRDQQAKAARP